MELQSEISRYTDAAKAAKTVESMVRANLLKTQPAPALPEFKEADHTVADDPMMVFWRH